MNSLEPEEGSTGLKFVSLQQKQKSARKQIISYFYYNSAPVFIFSLTYFFDFLNRKFRENKILEKIRIFFF
jgi:hypothetical protein